ncbi:FAD-dependent oxidoreductase [Montanilutibacter psychrotolerans]|nr:NAD(P)/FAD-dependent oxidoreductase [Lysobacter psychrotolerans]
MTSDNDAIPLVESDGLAAATQTHIESLSAAARGRLLRASEVERDLPGSPLAVTVDWVRTFLARPHPDVGRSGPVCPFTPTALALDTIWLTEITDRNPDPARLADVVGKYRDLFFEIEPRNGSVAINKTILIVFPNLGADAAALIDDVQRELKPSFVDLGLMLGEFHSRNESPGLRNPDFRPLRSPVPMVAIRLMVETDLPFLRRHIDEPTVRAAYLRSYLRRLGGTVRRNYFDQAVTALVETERELRGDSHASLPASVRIGTPAIAANDRTVVPAAAPADTAVAAAPEQPATATDAEADNGRVAIVGGGLAGSLLALSLARQGVGVDVYERRPDPRLGGDAGGRSINLGLSKRGIQALTEVGLIDEVMPLSVTMRGRVIHSPDGGTRFQPYGKNGGEVLHSIDRNELNRLLLDHAQRHPQVRLHFDHRLAHVDKDRRELELESNGERVRVRPSWVVGADGAFSRARQEMQRGERADFQQEYLEWGYKELSLSALPDGGSQIELEALHVWPRLHGLFVSHPNRDGSHTLTLFLPFEGPDSFATTTGEAEVKALFDKYFPDLVPLLPNLVDDWMSHPTGSLTTIRTGRWHRDDWIVLVGDACHAVYPFYGQGMNSAFEDCSALMAALARHGQNRAAAFAAYEQSRRPHTDTLAELSKANFVELKQKVKSPWFVARKRLDVALNRFLPKTWLPLYTMIAHTTIPYGDALARAHRQERFLAGSAVGLAGAIGVGAWLWLA